MIRRKDPMIAFVKQLQALFQSLVPAVVSLYSVKFFNMLS